MKSKDVRQKFISFFEEKSHQFVPGCSIVPENDPSLLFINAGMNQFKDVFLGTGNRSYKRAVNSQLCIRVSGKHNDLEDVGKDLTHLTSFEMLGNWSFGDYYKKEAIIWAWELLTTIFKIPKDKLVATVFEEDQEAFDIWRNETDINPDHIVKCDAKDNFWEMGATGPCGPCSELHVFLEDEPINFKLDQDILNSDKFIELWNLVFIQYNRSEDKTLELLPEQHVDTGAGLERLVAYLQGTPSNYQTDLFKTIIKEIEILSNKNYVDSLDGMPHRVIADHIRTLCVGIGDNVIPANEGRGYVLRRLLRRACRYVKKLGINDPVLYKLVEKVIDSMGDHFVHLKERKVFIEKVIKAEEESFLNTLSGGLELFESLVERQLKNKESIISGKEAFRLYDTYGFPIDLTQLLAEEKGFSINMVDYETELKKQQERSRKHSKFNLKNSSETVQVSADFFTGLPLHLAEDLNVAKGGEYRVISNRDEKIEMARHHSATHLLHEILRKELGDHVQQAGSMVDSEKLRFDFTHFESIPKEKLLDVEKEVNELISSQLDISISFSTLESAKEKGIMALFGEKYNPERVRIVDIGQVSIELCAGTHVNNTSLIGRFKIVSENAISAGTRRIEALAGDLNIKRYLIGNIQKKHAVISQLIEKNNLVNSKNNNFLNMLKTECSKNINDLSLDLIESYSDELDKFELSIHDQIKLQKKENLKKARVDNKQIIKTLEDSAEKITDQLSYIVREIDCSTVEQMRLLADDVTELNPSCIVVLLSKINQKGQMIVKYGNKVNLEKLPAVSLVKQIATIVGGGGGGRSHMAQAGGIKIDKLNQAVQEAKQIIKSLQ